MAWLRAEENPYFAHFVNRVWAHYFNRGLRSRPMI